MNKKWQHITRRFYKASRKRFDLELVPRKLLNEVAKDADGDQAYPKLPFNIFVDFMSRAILSVRKKPSTRRLARMSHLPSIQQLTDAPSVSHQAIADRLRSVDLETLQFVFQEVSQGASRLLGRGFRRRGGLRLFDCTTVEVSADSAPWAANNGDKNAVRLALGLNGVTDLPIVVLDASETTSDNTVFPAIVTHLQSGEMAVLDAGFTRLQNFQEILARGAHFVARMAQIYNIVVVRAFKLPTGGRAQYGEWRLLADERVLVGTPESGGPLEARRVHWMRLNSQGEEDHRYIWTDRFDLTPKRVLEMDRIRWRMEVQFRWLKSELGLDHLPSFDGKGVQAFFLLVMLAWIGLRVFLARQCGIPVEQFSCAVALDLWAIAIENYLLMEAKS